MRVFWPLINFLQALFLVLWSAGWISAALVLSLLTFNRELPLVMARRIWAPGLIWVSGCTFSVDPLPEIDWNQPHIFVMNHQSMLDIPCAVRAIPANMRF